jgi:hypothetical protein
LYNHSLRESKLFDRNANAKKNKKEGKWKKVTYWKWMRECKPTYDSDKGNGKYGNEGKIFLNFII